MFLIILLYMLLAGTFTIGKAAMLYAQPLFFIGIRMIAAGALLLGYMYSYKPEWLRFQKKHCWLFAQIVLFHIYLAYVLEFIALQTISSSKACLIYNLSPFITALFTYFLSAQKLSNVKWLGLLVGFCGFIPLLVAQSPAEGATVFALSWPEGLLLGSVVASAYGWIVMKRLVTVEQYSPVMVNMIGMLIGGLLALISSALWESGARIYDKPGALWYTVGYAGVLIIIANIIFYNLYGSLLRKYSATFLSFAGFTCPLFAAVYGRLFLLEPITGAFVLSVCIIGCGLYLFYKQELKEF